MELTVKDFFVIWACAGVLFATYFTTGYWKMRDRIRRWSDECEDIHMQEVIVEVTSEYKLKGIPEMRIMKGSEGPFTTGVLKNVIIMPDDALHEKNLRSP